MEIFGTGAEVSDAEFDEYFSHIDSDGSGAISKDEMIVFIK